MAIRTVTPMNELITAVVTACQGISHRKDTRYITTPTRVKRLVELGDLQGVRCAIGVSFGEWRAEPQACQRFDATMEIDVHCFVDRAGDPEGELLRLVSDVILALAADVTLGARAQWLFPRSFKPNVELGNRSGLAAATLTCEVLYRFDATAP